MSVHELKMIEVVYPFHLGGEMMEGYCCNDNQMAQLVLNQAIESATILERERIMAVIEKRESGECGFGVTHDLIEIVRGEEQ